MGGVAGLHMEQRLRCKNVIPCTPARSWGQRFVPLGTQGSRGLRQHALGLRFEKNSDRPHCVRFLQASRERGPVGRLWSEPNTYQQS